MFKNEEKTTEKSTERKKAQCGERKKKQHILCSRFYLYLDPLGGQVRVGLGTDDPNHVIRGKYQS